MMNKEQKKNYLNEIKYSFKNNDSEMVDGVCGNN